MNARQFINSALFYGFDFGVSRLPWFGWIVSLPMRIVFPAMAYEKVDRTLLRKETFLSVFLLGIALCFGLQAILAYLAGHLGTPDLEFGPSRNPVTGQERILFLDDIYNLINYLVLVPLYLVAGSGFALSVFTLKQRMEPMGAGYGFSLDDVPRPLFSGTFAFGCFLLLMTLLQAQYAVDLKTKSLQLYWFHGADMSASFAYNGYAYLLINAFLASFVIIIALLHIEMFRWGSIISRGIASWNPASADEENPFLGDGNRVKELLAPFAETALWSKGFALVLAINIYTWKLSGVSGGGGLEGLEGQSWFLRFTSLLYVLLVLWVVSLPRYRVQYELFKLRRREGVHEYFDLRMPWTIGWSVFIDLMLLFFFSTAIFGVNDILDLAFSLFEEQ